MLGLRHRNDGLVRVVVEAVSVRLLRLLLALGHRLGRNAGEVSFANRLLWLYRLEI
jgi:hypothetical protein